MFYACHSHTQALAHSTIHTIQMNCFELKLNIADADANEMLRDFSEENAMIARVHTRTRVQRLAPVYCVIYMI